MILLVFFGKYDVVPGRSVPCSDVLCHSAVVVQGFLLQMGDAGAHVIQNRGLQALGRQTISLNLGLLNANGI